MISTKRFQLRKEDFSCFHCGKENQGTGVTNHCQYCLWSAHVDIFPGDRRSSCQGQMRPIGIDTSGGGTQVFIIHQCQKCQFTRKNKASHLDQYDEILRLSSSF